MPDSGWKPVVWKDKTPKPIRRSDGKVLKSPKTEQPQQSQPLLKIREEPQGEVIVCADERNTVRHVMRTGTEEPVKAKTWEEQKQEVLNDLNDRVGKHEQDTDDSDDGISINVEVREV